ncbi:TPA: GNAT family N-acetyltransferase [Streptococcus pneumoniae]|nr:GNAT family N-acetyltransferase [Streptococcus pneumoniae]
MELFKTWKKNMVLYGLKSQIGTVYRNNDRTTSFYDVGNFLYLAGELDSRFWDAHNEASKKVAEFLGYELSEPYEAFELEEILI